LTVRRCRAAADGAAPVAHGNIASVAINIRQRHFEFSVVNAISVSAPNQQLVRLKTGF